jgi:hypothetical protein
MAMRRTKMTLPSSCLGIALFLGTAAATSRLSYHDRGDRYEGIRSNSVSAYDIDILSFITDYVEGHVLPDTLRVAFHLPRSKPPFLTVREIDFDYSYWMDRARPRRPWKDESLNVFSWPSEEVLRKLSGIRDMYSLGVVIRLQDPIPRIEETMVPATFYSKACPDSVTAYTLWFKTSASTRMTVIVRDPHGTLVFSQSLQHVVAGEPYALRWPCRDRSAGWYVVVLHGFMRNSNVPVNKIIHFYHHPSLQ